MQAVQIKTSEDEQLSILCENFRLKREMREMNRQHEAQVKELAAKAEMYRRFYETELRRSDAYRAYWRKDMDERDELQREYTALDRRYRMLLERLFRRR